MTLAPGSPPPPPATAKPDAETLVRENLHLARVAAGRYAKRHRANDPDESYSDALLGLWEAACGYDPALSSFRTHAERIMRCRMLDGTRGRNGVRTLNGVLVSRALPTVSLSDPLPDREGLTVGDTAADPKAPRPDAGLGGDCLHILRPLDSFSRRIVIRHAVEGRTQKEVALEVGLSESRISQLYASAIDRLRGEGRAAVDAPTRPPAGPVAAAIDPARLYTLPEVAAMIPSPMPGRHVRVRQVRRWVATGRLRVEHIEHAGRSVARIPGTEVARLRRSHEGAA